MKTKVYFLIIICFAFSGCKKDKDDKTVPTITMTTVNNNVTIRLIGSGEFSIDWGDGSEIETHTLTELNGWSLYTHSYLGTSSRIITITGNFIKFLDCASNQLTSLDVSKNTKLEYLSCGSNQLKDLNVSGATELVRMECGYNQLTSLDVSKNTALVELYCFHNQLSSLDVSKNTVLTILWCMDNLLINSSLDALFETLHGITIAREKTIIIGNNPGTDGCDRSIATSKGWTVTNFPM